MISLSTCWVPPGVECLRDLFEVAMELGYRSFEIGVSRLPFNLDKPGAMPQKLTGGKFGCRHDAGIT